MKMDMTQRPQSIEEFMALLNVKPGGKSKIMKFLNKPVLGTGRRG